MKRFSLATLLLVSTTVITAPAFGQVEASAVDAKPQASGLGEITVTAQRRQESAQSVPVSVTVVKPEVLTQRGGGISDLVQLVPGVQANAFQDRNDLAFSIRGQQFTFGTLFPAVISYFAEVPLQRLSTGQTFDMASVQVLKGPQGTLFGRVTDGGAVLLTPQAPTNELGGWIEGRVGNYNHHQVSGAINVPLLPDKVMVRLAYDINRQDGFTHNDFGGKDLDDVSYEGVRFSATVKPTDGIENTTIINYNHSSTNGTGTVLTGFNPNALSYNGSAASIPIFEAALAAQQARGARRVYVGNDLYTGGDGDGILYKRQALFVTNSTKIELGENLILKNIFGYIWNKEARSQDYDGVGDFNYVQESYTDAMIPKPELYYEQISNELQLQGTLFDDSLNFIVGTYFDRQKKPGNAESFTVIFNALQAVATSYPVTTSRAVYGQIGYDLSSLLPGLKFNAGLRYTHDKQRSDNSTIMAYSLAPDALPHGGTCDADLTDYPGAFYALPCTTFRTSSKVVTYTIGLDWQISRKVFAYITQRKGYRPGGINAGQVNYVNLPAYGPEYTLNREIGLKADWSLAGMPVRTNIAVFRDAYRDIQAQLQTVNSDGTVYTSLVNASRARIQGIELDVTAIPLPGLTLTGSWAYLDAKYLKKGISQEKIDAACPANVLETASDPTMVCPNNPLPQTPKNTLRLAFDYQLPLGADTGRISLGGDMYYVADNYINGRDVASGTIQAYTVYNANVSWQNVMGHPVDLSFFVNNLTNKLYEASVDSVVAVGEFGTRVSFYGPPRMYGAALKYHF